MMTKDNCPDGSALSEGLGLAPERAEWVRAWFAERYADSGVFDEGAEALTLEAACQLVADAQAAERQRWMDASAAVSAGAEAAGQPGTQTVTQIRLLALGPNVRAKQP
jgi:hypothetical protein